MSDTWTYLCILKSLQAEYAALADLDPAAASGLTPLIQLWDRGAASDDADPEADDVEPPDTGGQQLIWGEPSGEVVWRRLKKQLLDRITGWPASIPLLLDGGWLEGAAGFENVMANCRAFGQVVLPVTGTVRPDAYQAAVTRFVQPTGAVLRLGRPDFEVDRETLRARVDDLLARLGLQPQAVDVVLDLRVLAQPYRERDEVFAESMLRTLPYLDRWRNLAIAGSGMPANAGGFNRDDITPRNRVEWWVWQELRRRAATIGRVPVFGDYGVIHPERVEQRTESRRLPRIPAITYTTRDDFLMVRGIDLNSGDPQVVRALFQRFMDVPEWCGPTFSAGDAWIAKAAAGEINLGNWTSWKRAGENHHLTYISRLLATQLEL